jgi:urea ABC transporter ATP-binding protein UrtE
MLLIEKATTGYGKVQVLRGIDLTVEPGDRTVLLGRNGMGKTTLARMLVGLLPTWSGTIRLDGKRIDNRPPYTRIRDGLGYVPQGRGLFRSLTVMENLQIGTHGSKRRARTVPDLVFDQFPVLAARRHQVAGTLSGGEQQQLAIGRALVSGPRILILDEPSEGIQPNLVAEIAERLRRLAEDQQIGILLIEQNLEAATTFADRCLFMEKGSLVHACAASQLRDASLVDRLLGV